MYNNQKITDIIKKRKSIRFYNDKPISLKTLDKIKNFINNLDSPFCNYFRIEFFHIDKDINGQDFGSYGIIKGSKFYIGIVVRKEEFSYENLGFVFEKLVLFLTSLEIGTCWFGGNLKGSGFEKAMNLSEGEVFPIMSPLGYSVEKYNFTEKLIKLAIGSNKRKPNNKLFFENNFNTPLDMESSNNYSEALEMVRLAPSAINLQPWRVLKVDNFYHFYTTNPKKTKHNFFIQRIDLGIAMSHFHLVLEEKGIKGQFIKEDPKIICEYNYVTTWKEF